MIVTGLILPALDQIARLGSLGITMKALSHAVMQSMALDLRVWLSLMIFAAFMVAALIQFCSGRVKRGLKIEFTGIARRAYGMIMADCAKLPPGEKGEKVRKLLREETDFIRSATSGLSAMFELLSSTLIIAVLLGILLWFSPVVGGILFFSGLTAFLILRMRVRRPAENSEMPLVAARAQVRKELAAIAVAGDDKNVLIEKYADNEFDKIQSRDHESGEVTPTRIAATTNAATAVIMALVFFLISAEGAIDESQIDLDRCVRLRSSDYHLPGKSGHGKVGGGSWD